MSVTNRNRQGIALPSRFKAHGVMNVASKAHGALDVVSIFRYKLDFFQNAIHGEVPDRCAS